MKHNLSMLLLTVCILVMIGCKKKKDEQPSPQNNLPESSFTFTSVRTIPVFVQFINTSTNSLPGTAYFWNFGDGQVSVRTNPVNEFSPPAFPNSYQVTMVRTLPSGQKDSVTKIVNLEGPSTGPSGSSERPSAVSAADFIYGVTKQYTVTFVNKSKNANSYRWDFGDGQILDTLGGNVLHKYTAPGIYKPKLIATGTGGADTSGTTITF